MIDLPTGIFLFILGALFGSFVNVIALRYDPDKFLFSRTTTGGRSHCPNCKTQLRWYELIPFVSFIIQRGKCRTCGARLSLQYFLVELIGGLIFLIVPLGVHQPFITQNVWIALSALWILAFLLLLIAALIDIRLTLIPDEINVLVFILGVVNIFLAQSLFQKSFLGPFAMLFGGFGPLWLMHLVGALVGALFFGLLIFVTRGRGMGMGDLKLALALGMLFGWPDVSLIIGLAFIIGSFVALGFMAGHRKSLKSLLPFGPFLVLASFVVFLWGERILNFYFRLFPVQ